MNSPYLTSVFAEAKDFGRIKDFPQYKKEVQKAIKNAFKALKVDLDKQDKARGLKFSHFSLMKILQDKLHREAPQDLNIVLRDGINGLYQCIYRSGERTFYTDLMIPPQKLNLMSVNEVEKKVNEICRDTELQDYNTQDDIKVNTKVRPDRSFPVSMQESIKLCPVCKDKDCKCDDGSEKPYLESVFSDDEDVPPYESVQEFDLDAHMQDKKDSFGLDDEDDYPAWYGEFDRDAKDRVYNDDANLLDESSPYLTSIFKEKKDEDVDLGDGYYVKKAGLDANGNWSIWVAKGSNKARKIQTNGNINSAHQKKLSDIRDDAEVKTAILDYIKDYEDWS